MTNLQFKKDVHDQLFHRTLQIRVNQYFQKNKLNKTGNKTLIIKSLALFINYCLLWILFFFATENWQLFLLYGCSGILTIFLALNVAHDAAHQTFSSQKKVNDLLLNTFDFLGASGYMWRLKHVHSHHPHVNIPDMDGDIKQSNLVRIFPNAPFLNFHKYQYLYMPIFYGFYTLVWLTFRDFKDFFYSKISGKPNLRHPKKEVIKLFLAKFFFFSRMIILPWIFTSFSFGTIILAFLIFHFCASYTVALALISAHIGEHSVYPSPDQNNQMPLSWVRHQLVTTTDFSTQNKIITHLFGGFNHHVVHHLFPRICHIHYPALTKILVQTCHEFNMPYAVNERLSDAIRSHFRFLKKRSTV